MTLQCTKENTVNRVIIVLPIVNGSFKETYYNININLLYTYHYAYDR